MSNDYSRLIESYATTKCGPLSDVVIEQPCFSGKTTITIEGWSLDALIAAGMARHWGTSLLRLKYGLAASEYRAVLAQFLRLAEEIGNRQKWTDQELTRFLAVEALHCWLLDRSFRGRGEWQRRCVTLHKRLDQEAREAAAAIASRLIMRFG